MMRRWFGTPKNIFGQVLSGILIIYRQQMKLRNFFIVILMIVLASCEYDESTYRYNVGTDFVDDPAVLRMTDTLTLRSYTVSVDSLKTSRGYRFLAGRYENKYGVQTECESYFRIDPCETYNLPDSTKFDSACFVMKWDGYYFGDSTQLCEFEVCQLTDDMKVDVETKYIYNNQRFPHETTPLARFTLNLADDKSFEYEDLDSVSVRIDDAFGRTLYNFIYDENPILDDPEEFKKEYKGFMIKPADNNVSSVVGFIGHPDSLFAPRIRIYYSDKTPNDEMYIEYSLETLGTSTEASDTNYFASNYIANDYSKFFVSQMPEEKEKLSSEETGNITILQGGLDLMTRVEIPYVDYIRALGSGSVFRAILYFEPVDGTYAEEEDLPSYLEVYMANNNNEFYSQLYKAGSSDPTYAYLHKKEHDVSYDSYYDNETYYSVDITQYLVNEYIDVDDPKYFLLLTLPQSTVTNNVEQLIIGGPSHPTQKMRLKLYFTTYTDID
jgi:hypothetical protein